MSFSVEKEVKECGAEGRKQGRKRELTFDRGVIFVHEVALYQLDGQAGLSDSSSPDDDELVFSQELCDEASIS